MKLEARVALIVATTLATACLVPESPEELAAARAREGFSKSYRLAVASVQDPVRVAPGAITAGGPDSDLLGQALGRLLEKGREALILSRTDLAGEAPIARLDTRMRNVAARRYGVDAKVLPRQSYGATTSLAGDRKADLIDVLRAADRAGFDAALYVNLQPEISGSLGSYSLDIDVRTEMRSLRTKAMLLRSQQRVSCDDLGRSQTSPGVDHPLRRDDIGYALARCYERVGETLRELPR